MLLLVTAGWKKQEDVYSEERKEFMDGLLKEVEQEVKDASKTLEYGHKPTEYAEPMMKVTQRLYANNFAYLDAVNQMRDDVRAIMPNPGTLDLEMLALTTGHRMKALPRTLVDACQKFLDTKATSEAYRLLFLL